MRRVIAITILIMISIISKAGDSTFTIIGKFDKVKSGKVYLTIFSDDNSKRDSSFIKGGKFRFAGSVKGAMFASLTVPFKRSDFFTFYIEPGKMTILGGGDSLKLLTVKGSSMNDDDKLLKKRMEFISKWEDANGKLFDEAFTTKNKVVMDSLDEVDNDVLREKRKVVTQFVKDFPHSERSVTAIIDNYSYYAEASDVEPLYGMLDERLKHSEKGNKIQKMLEVYRTVAPGKKAPDFTQVSPDGNLISLSSVKGKYILVDFWASWCGPCRRENPNIVRIYSEFKNKGLKIFGVSYDTKKEKH